uniref:Uncharacterized protein n=1 Tax=Triticum urartu TaxID=4572 RepID=A0A8R7QG12_TRIUA
MISWRSSAGAQATLKCWGSHFGLLNFPISAGGHVHAGAREDAVGDTGGVPTTTTSPTGAYRSTSWCTCH